MAGPLHLTVKLPHIDKDSPDHKASNSDPPVLVAAPSPYQALAILQDSNLEGTILPVPEWDTEEADTQLRRLLESFNQDSVHLHAQHFGSRSGVVRIGCGVCY